MKITLGVLTLVFGAYVAIQSYLIATAGVANQIVQLAGDGGGGMILAVLCVTGGLSAFMRPKIATILFVLAITEAILTGVLYQDAAMLYLAIGPVLFSVLSIALLRRKGPTRRGSETTLR